MKMDMGVSIIIFSIGLDCARFFVDTQLRLFDALMVALLFATFGIARVILLLAVGLDVNS